MRALAMTGMVTASMIPSIIAGVAHPGDAAGGADVGRHALERHDGDGAGILGDVRVVGRDDVHDDAALEHLGEALLGGPGGGFDGHVGLVLRVRSREAARPAGPGVLARSSRVGAASRAGLSHGFLGRPAARSGVRSRGRAPPKGAAVVRPSRTEVATHRLAALAAHRTAKDDERRAIGSRGD